MPNANPSPKTLNGDPSKQPHPKYNNFEAELKLVKAYLTTQIATSTMVAVALDIYRPNLCRHVAKLTKQGLLAVVCTSKCQVTGFQAQYLTCNPDLIERIKEKKGFIG
jgi:hypothetical protein